MGKTASSTEQSPSDTGIVGRKLVVVNLGISTFADDLEKQGVKVVRVNWKPPAEGDQEMLDLLDRLGA